MDARQILKHLPDLSRDDLLEIKNRATFLMQSKNKTRETASDPKMERFYRSLQDVLNTTTDANAPPLSVVAQNNRLYPNLKRAWQNIEDWLGRLFPGISPAQRIKLHRVVATATIQYLRERDVPVSLNSVLQQLAQQGRLEEVVDDSFPGYAESGRLLFLASPRSCS